MSTAMKDFTIVEMADSALIEVHLSGELTKSDYDSFEPALAEALSTREKARILILLDEFEGWSPGAAWEDFKLGLRHFSDIDRIAVVGEETWEKVITILAKPFTMAEVRYFEKSEEMAARRWLTA